MDCHDLDDLHTKLIIICFFAWLAQSIKRDDQVEWELAGACADAFAGLDC
jgi:hypothetical protein